MKVTSFIPFTNHNVHLSSTTNASKGIGFRHLLAGQQIISENEQPIHPSKVEEIGKLFVTLLKNVQGILKGLEHSHQNYQEHEFMTNTNVESKENVETELYFSTNSDIFHSKMLLEEWFQTTIQQLNGYINTEEKHTEAVLEPINNKLNFNSLKLDDLLSNIYDSMKESNQKSNDLVNIYHQNKSLNELKTINQQVNIISNVGQMTKAFKEISQLLHEMIDLVGQLEEVLKSDKNVNSEFVQRLQLTVNRFFETNKVPILVDALKFSHLENVKINQTFTMNLQKVHFSHHQNKNELDMLNMSEEPVSMKNSVQNQSLLSISDTIFKQEIKLQLSTFNGDTRVDQTTQKEFVEKFMDILKSSKVFRSMDGKASLTVRLHPENLGTLTVKLIQTNNETVAKIIASTQSAKELLEHSSHLLKQALPNTEVIIDRFDILEERQMESFQRQRERESREEEQHNHSRKQDEKSESFSEKLEQELNFIV